jgi:hypothetical protein
MGFVVPNTIEHEVLTTLLTPPLTLRLYGNNVTPNSTSATADFTEIAGGGYANKPLIFANWTIVEGTPSEATYSAVQQWTFTGPINAPGTIYGYYVTRNSDSKLVWAERFPAANVPFSPIAGSIVGLLPRFDAQSFN